MKKMSEFAQRLQRLMADRDNMTRADLERATGIPYHRINPWFVRETAKPNAQDVQTVAAYFGVAPDYLLHGITPDARDEFIDELIERAKALDDDKFNQLRVFLEFIEDETKNRSQEKAGN
jgi:transcriptional regulator with XRE-family HTH domain